MNPLKTLVIRKIWLYQGGCWGVNEEKFIEILAKQNKIKCLSIGSNLLIKILTMSGSLPELWKP